MALILLTNKLLLIFILYNIFNTLLHLCLATPIIIGPDIYEFDNELHRLKASLDTANPESAVYKRKLDAYNKLLLDRELKYNESDSIVISTSRHYYNYRHAGNVYSVLNTLKQHGGHSTNQMQVILPDDYACAASNCFPGRIYVTNESEWAYVDTGADKDNLNHQDTVINYRRNNLDKAKFRYIITQRYPAYYPRFARSPFRADLYWTGRAPKPNLFVFITGHGGESYMQINQREFVFAQELNVFFSEINAKQIYSRFFLVVDTCEASTFVSEINENIPLGWMTSSIAKESSYSLHNNPLLSVTNVDQLSYYITLYINNICNSIRSGFLKTSIPRLFVSAIQRYLNRSFITSTVASKNLPGLSRSNDPHVKASDKSNESEKTNLYVGQFIFNYRRAYTSSHSLPIDNTNKKYLKLLKLMGDNRIDLEKKISSQAYPLCYADFLIFPSECKNKNWYYEPRLKYRDGGLDKLSSKYSLLGQYFSLPHPDYMQMKKSGKDFSKYFNNIFEGSLSYISLLFYASVLCNILLYYHIK